MLQIFSRHPAARMLFPMIGGIICGDYFYHFEWVSIGLPIFLCATVGMLVAHRLHRSYEFGCAAALFFFMLGAVRTAGLWNETKVVFPEKPALYEVLLLDKPQEKDRSFLCKASLRDGSSLSLLLYVAKDSLSRQLVAGDRLGVYTTWQLPVEDVVPEGFNYGRYLVHKGVSGTAYVASGYWKKIGHCSQIGIGEYASRCREQVLQLYRCLGLQGDEWAVLSALTVGEKEHLDEDIRTTYAVAGASHVLALSGLHIGLLYGLLYLLFMPVWKRWKLCKLPLSLVMIVLLWTYAFFTGLSTSVVRAVVMCTLFILFSFRTEKIVTFDTLLATAFLMLLVQPFWLFEVGFQLSFAAVAAILWIQPRLYASVPVNHILAKKLWGLLTVSVSAQLGTAPLVLFYFSYFSTHFLLTNVWVVPLVTLIMYLSVVMLLLTPFPVLQQGLASVLSALLHWQNEGLRWIEHLPYATIDQIYVSVTDVFLMYLCIALGYHALTRRLAVNQFRFLGVCLLAVAFHVITLQMYAPQPSVIFYALRGSTAVHCLSRTSQSWLVSSDSTSRFSSLERTLYPYWNRMQLTAPVRVKGPYESEELCVQEQVISYAGRRICLLSDNRWKNRLSSSALPVDFLYVVRGYKGGLKGIEKVFKIQTVVVDPALPTYWKQSVFSDCKTLGIPCVEVANNGMLAYRW